MLVVSAQNRLIIIDVVINLNLNRILFNFTHFVKSFWVSIALHKRLQLRQLVLVQQRLQELILLSKLL